MELRLSLPIINLLVSRLGSCCSRRSGSAFHDREDFSVRGD
jgi:hypothetical protein